MSYGKHRAASTKYLPMAKLRHELHQSQLAARSEAEEAKCLQESCEVMANHSEHATMKGHEMDKTRIKTISDYNTRLHVANEELKISNQRRNQYQAEVFDFRREKYELRQEFQNAEQIMRQQLAGYEQQAQQCDATTKQSKYEMMQHIQNQHSHSRAT